MFTIVVLLAGCLSAPAAAQHADLLVENAVVYTLDPARPVAKAVAISGNRILAVGDGLTALAGPKTRRIDVNGQTVIPGFIDSHAHMRGLGAMLESADFRHTKTTREIAEWVKREASRRKPGEWIVARNWDQTNWGGAFPLALDLDWATADHPVFLSRVDGHAAWVNSRAMQLAKLNAETPDPPGGRIVRDAQGQPTGVLIDRAMGLVRSMIPPPDDEQVKRQIELAARECARLGITTVHDAGVSSADLRAYRQLITEGRLPVRVYAMIGGEGSLWQEYLNRGPEINEFLTVRSIKLYADGALGSRGAALWQPYSDESGNSGLMLTTVTDVERVAKQAAAKGFQVCTHAIGDKANKVVLNAYRNALGGRNNKRFRVEHAQVVALPDFPLFRNYSIIASMQATHATSDMRWAEKRLGPDRIAGAYAWRRFLDLGVPVANGSDFPVEEPNPVAGFYASITRQDRMGQPPDGWTPSQKMNREEALRSWSLTGAYAAFEESLKGSIEAGKFADLVVLDTDIMKAPPSAVANAKVKMTILGGRQVQPD